jgi:hypothetical protein
MPVLTFGTEDIRQRQRLVQAEYLQFSTIVRWKLLALCNSLRLATLPRRYRALLLVTKGRYKGGTQICPSLSASSHFCTLYAIPYSLVLSSFASFSYTISCTFVTAVCFALSPCSLQSHKSR